MRGIPVLLTIVALLGACSPLRTAEAVGLLRDVSRQEVPADLARSHVAYGSAGRRADLYQQGEASAALILVPGAAAAALDDPRLIGFAGALSRRGFLVMVPELAGEDPLQVSAADVAAVAEAVAFLRRRAGVAALGLAAPSYAAGPAILAALAPETAPHVRFIVTIGAYYDIVAGITFVTTGAYRERPGEAWQVRPVDPAARWIFLQANTHRLESREDAGLLREIAAAHLAGIDPRPAVARLGEEGRRVRALFANSDPDRVPALIAALPRQVREEIEALDLARRDLRELQAELILVHGRDDRLVPHSESRRLAEAVGEQRARLYLLGDLAHVDLGSPGPGDLLTLLAVAYQVLAQRDAAPAPLGHPFDAGGAAKAGAKDPATLAP